LNALNQNKQETESLLAQLTSIGYRFTRPFTARESYSDDAPTEKLLKAIILDTETTGVDHAAHNAKFDRIFVEERFPYFADKVWACSFAQMPWTEEGLGTSKLEFLAYRYGFHYDAHRASNDCHALLEVLQQDLPESGVKALLRLLENARTKDYKVSALNSPFESKDVLKARGYRWDAERKLWSTYIAMQLLDQEVEWIRGAVYNQRSFKLELEKMDAFNRFSVRQGSIQVSEY
jgi:DNA polymerase-3 subunit epsilon